MTASKIQTGDLKLETGSTKLEVIVEEQPTIAPKHAEITERSQC